MGTGVSKTDDKSVTHSSFYVEMVAGVVKKDDKSVSHSSFYVEMAAEAFTFRPLNSKSLNL